MRADVGADFDNTVILAYDATVQVAFALRPLAVEFQRSPKPDIATEVLHRPVAGVGHGDGRLPADAAKHPMFLAIGLRVVVAGISLRARIYPYLRISRIAALIVWRS